MNAHFAAIEPERAWQAALARWIAAARTPRDRIRWVPPETLHLTLWYFGPLEPDAAARVAGALPAAAAGLTPFELHAAGLGCFPSRHHPRVLWLGADDPAEGCRRWIAAAASRLEPLGIVPETRPFTAHVTLARAAHPAAARRLAACAELAAPELPPLPVTHVTLFESLRSPDRPRYEPRGRAALGG